MVILNRKRIILVITCVFISVFCFMFYNFENSKIAVPTVSLPVSNKVVVIDAGHGIPDEGGEMLKLL